MNATLQLKESGELVAMSRNTLSSRSPGHSDIGNSKRKERRQKSKLIRKDFPGILERKTKTEKMM